MLLVIGIEKRFVSFGWLFSQVRFVSVAKT